MSARAAPSSWVDRVSSDDALWARISDDPSFSSAASWFDTTIVLESDDRAMFLKIYRGRIIEAGTGHGFLGYAFAISASEETWHRVLAEGGKGLHRALTAGDVRPRGDLIEFNRGVKMVSLLVDHLAKALR